MGCAGAVNGAEDKACIDTQWRSPADATMSATDLDLLAYLGHPKAILLGAGGEARVYALDDARVVRILRAGAALADAEQRASLMAEIQTGARHLTFQVPSVDSVQAWNGRVFSVEPRLSGQPVSQRLGSVSGTERTDLLLNYLNVVGQIRTISIDRPSYGPLLGGAELHKREWRSFLRARLERSLASCPTDLRPAVAAMRDIDLPVPSQAALVHMDYFPGNVLSQGSSVTAVLDFGPSTIFGDPRMDAWSAVAYLDTEISPDATEADRKLAMGWLAKHNLTPHYPDAKRWLAAYWSFAADDQALMSWCRRILAKR